MYSQLVFLAVVWLSLVSSQTTPKPPPESKQCGFGDLEKCCPKLPALFTDDSINKCPPRPTSVRTPTNRCTVAVIGNMPGFNRMVKCLFKENGYLQTNGFANLNALNTKLGELSHTSTAWTDVIKASMEKCTSTLVKETSRPRVAGPSRVSKCVFKQFMSKCPNPIDTPYCKSLLSP